MNQIVGFMPCHFPTALAEQDPKLFQSLLNHFKGLLVECCARLVTREADVAGSKPNETGGEHRSN